MNGKQWLPEHTELLKRLAGFAYDHEIAKATGHCVKTIQRRRLALGIPVYRGKAVYAPFSALPAMSLAAIERACK